MILQRLYEYAVRHGLADDPAFEEHPVRWLVCISSDGTLHDLKLLSGGKPGNRRDRGAVLSVPRWQKRSGIQPEPHFLADESRFVLGLKYDGKGGVEQSLEPRKRFTALVGQAAAETGDPTLRIVHEFLLGSSPALLAKSSLVALAGIAPGDALVPATLVRGAYRPVTEADTARNWWRGACTNAEGESGVSTTCLVTGRHAPAARLHPPISGMAGGRPTGMSLVSFNLDAFCSFGLEQNANAPVSHQAAARYAAALNSLLSRDPARRRCIVLPGDVSVCIFTGDGPEDGAALAIEAIDPSPDDLLVADELVTWRAVEAVYGGPWTGHETFLPEGDRTPVYVLVLSPNSARIVVRDWMETRVDEVVASLRTYFDDLAVVDPFTHRVQRGFLLRTPNAAARREAGAESIAAVSRVPTGLLTALRGKGKDDNASPAVEKALVLAALDRRRPFPRELLGAALRRIRAEAAESKYGAVSKERAAVIKGVINRELRRPGSPLRHCLTSVDPNFQELTPMLDESCTIPAYLLGRLMAVLEQAQAKAIPGANATVVDRAYGAASATPATVMPRLLRGVRHHLSKVKSDAPGLAVTYERLLDEISAKFADPATAFPASLSLQEQGLFAIGYYQQRAELFRPRDSKTSGSAA